MRHLTVVLKNYRCFSDETRAEFTLSPGCTALVGPNNAGKTAFLRFLWEMQPLWAQLRHPSNIARLCTDQSPPHTLELSRGIGDIRDLRCDYTNRPMEVELRFDVGRDAKSLSKLVIRAQSSDSARGVLAEAFYGPQALKARPSGNGLVDKAGGRIGVEEASEWGQTLSDTFFAPAFRNVINAGGGTHFEMHVGTSLVQLWDAWKNGGDRQQKLAIQNVTTDLRRIFRFERLEINANSERQALEVVANGLPYRLTDMGSGLSQFIMLFANAAIRSPETILIDEPELSLHPSLQLDLLTSLGSYAKSGCVVFGTHSLGLARAGADTVIALAGTSRGSRAAPLEGSRSFAEMLGEMSFAGYRDLGYRSVLLVEGVSEVRVAQQFLRLFDKDHSVVCIPLGGTAMITAGREHELAEIGRLTKDVFVLIDSERGSLGEPLAQDRAAFLRTCSDLGFAVHATDRRATENYFPPTAVASAFAGKFEALTPFERLQDRTNGWGKTQNWRAARYVTNADLMDTDVGEFLARIPS